MLVASLCSMSSGVEGLALGAMGAGLRSCPCLGFKVGGEEDGKVTRLVWYAHGQCLWSHACTCVQASAEVRSQTGMHARNQVWEPIYDLGSLLGRESSRPAQTPPQDLAREDLEQTTDCSGKVIWGCEGRRITEGVCHRRGMTTGRLSLTKPLYLQVSKGAEAQAVWRRGLEEF